MAYKQLKLWFDKELCALLSEKITSVYKPFNSNAFRKSILADLQNLELKDRVEKFADGLHQHLPSPYKKNISILLKILGPENQEETGMFKKYFWVMPIAKYVEKYGLDHFNLSLDAIEEITKRNTGEYAVRPFIEKDPNESLIRFAQWSKDENKHLRRLSSEGIRSKLPWAKKLSIFIADPTPVINILENLKEDPSKYVQKSVANNLNDLLKDNYTFTIKIIQGWSKNAGKNRQWIIKHALRNQIKAGNQEAIEILTSFKED